MRTVPAPNTALARRRVVRYLPAAAGGVGITAALAACGGAAQPPAGTKTLAPVTLTWAQRAIPEYIPKEQPVIDGFREKRPHVTVERVAGFDTTKLLASLAGGSAPDTAWVEGADLPNVASKGGAVEVTGYWKRDAREIDQDDFYPPVLQDVTWQGKLWGTSFGTAPNQPVYNRELFARSALPSPGELAEKNQWTWDALADVTRRLAADARFRQAGVLPSVSLVGIMPWLWNNGADLFNAERTTVIVDSPAAADAVQFLVDLRWKLRAWPAAAEIDDLLAPSKDLKSGALGIEWLWHGGANNLRDVVQFDWDVAPNPRGARGAVAVVKGNGECILKGSKLEEEGWQWIKHIASKEGDAALVKSGRAVHRRKSTETLFNKEFHPPAATKWVVAAYNQGRVLPLVPAWTEMSRVWGEAMAPVWLNQLGARAGLAEAQRRLQAALVPG